MDMGDLLFRKDSSERPGVLGVECVQTPHGDHGSSSCVLVDRDDCSPDVDEGARQGGRPAPELNDDRLQPHLGWRTADVPPELYALGNVYCTTGTQRLERTPAAPVRAA